MDKLLQIEISDDLNKKSRQSLCLDMFQNLSNYEELE